MISPTASLTMWLLSWLLAYRQWARIRLAVTSASLASSSFRSGVRDSGPKVWTAKMMAISRMADSWPHFQLTPAFGWLARHQSSSSAQNTSGAAVESSNACNRARSKAQANRDGSQISFRSASGDSLTRLQCWVSG